MTRAAALQVKIVENRSKLMELVEKVEWASVFLNNLKVELHKATVDTNRSEGRVNAYMRAGERDLEMSKSLTLQLHTYYMKNFLPRVLNTGVFPRYVFERDVMASAQTSQHQQQGYFPSYPQCRPPYPQQPYRTYTRHPATAAVTATSSYYYGRQLQVTENMCLFLFRKSCFFLVGNKTCFYCCIA